MLVILQATHLDAARRRVLAARSSPMAVRSQRRCTSRGVGVGWGYSGWGGVAAATQNQAEPPIKSTGCIERRTEARRSHGE